MDSSLLADVLACSAQLACIAALGGVLPALLRMDVPGVRYTFYRALLALCLLLPVVQGRQAPPEASSAISVASSIAAVSVDAGAAASQVVVPWAVILGVLIVGGVVVRGLWIGAGLIRLRQLRRSGSVPQDQAHDELQHMLGTHAEIRYLAGLGSPKSLCVLRFLSLLAPSLGPSAWRRSWQRSPAARR
jgi:hypothetical protein